MGPLHGVKVVEMAGLAPAPFGAMMLADLGADVLRIDRTGPSASGLAAPAGPLDRGKHRICLDIKNTEHLGLLYAIVESADVFIEGFRPGVAERLGIGPDELLGRQPGLIYGRMTGWGQAGPMASVAGHDINYIGLSGALSLSGRANGRPTPAANLLADFAGGGMLLALGVIAALYERRESDRGQVVDAAMVDGSALLTAFIHGMYGAGLWNDPPGENVLEGGAAPFYNVYECADGKFVAVGCVEYPFYVQMLAELGIDDTELPFQLDRRGWPQIRALLESKFKERSRDEWAELFAVSDACVTPILEITEVHEHTHNQARESFIEIDGVRQPAPAPRFSRTIVEHPTAIRDGSAALTNLLTSWKVDPDRLAKAGIAP
ncbi:CaiB/BaiF CoA transferase family protein [Mycobacteriaceae bacterium NPDC060252]